MPVSASSPLHSLEHVDAAGFAREIRALGEEIRANLGEDDYRHLRKMERWGRLCTVLGYATAWIAPNPLSAALLCQGRTTRWMLGHHIFHRGYDRVPGIPVRYTSKGFARGWRRYIDWFDWWLPEAWDHMHTTLHHYNTGDPVDADLVEATPGPNKFVRTLVFGWYTLTWKWFYYAFYTMRELQNERERRAQREKGGPGRAPARGTDNPYRMSRPDMRETPFLLGVKDLIDLSDKNVREVWRRCLLPFGLFQFVAVPLLFLPLGMWAAFSVLCNVVLGDLLTNFQGFLCNRPSHTGDDLFLFDTRVQSKEEFYVRQVIGTTNYRTGGNPLNFVQFWINYQIEHHLWPNIPMLKYMQYQPRVKALCEKYGLPYAQESVWKRFARLYRVSMGEARMRKISTSHLTPEAAPRASAAIA